ncbi:MAG TPA: LLM class flavin-dependent oxidoreductase [Bdellovibrionales bacterium]|nr:LLM class flavin-dependent oxidoreductase [Bdellovibrionales bacterium]
MKHDIFLSICQTEVDGYLPSERTMWKNFFDQVRLADDLGFTTAWVAETHLSCQVQKGNPGAVIPNFIGEIGLNTDILQVAHKVFAQTKRIHVGSAIRNILCNGGPIAHAEAIRTFLSLHGIDENEKRLLEIGFASGRFPFSNTPYGIKPRNELELKVWPVLRGLVFQEATEIFLRFLKGEVFASKEVTAKQLTRELFRTEEEWSEVYKFAQENKGTWQVKGSRIEIPPYWVFDTVGVIPIEAPMHLLRLTIGAHDARSQNFANDFLAVGVFNLSITPNQVIEETHKRMQGVFNPKGGEWTRSHMPRTVLVFVDENADKAKREAEKALTTYWKAIEGTLDPKRVEQAVGNALVGTPSDIIAQMKERFHPEDRLMLWFDLNNHDNDAVKKSMRMYMEKVVPHV